MLTRELAIAEYDFRESRILPDRLTRQTHGHFVDFAEAMLDVYRKGAGRTRKELHRDVHDVFADADDCPIRRIDAFCKLLDDVSQYDRDRRGKAAQLRKRVFRLAGRKHPLVSHPDRLFEAGESAVKQEIATEIGRPWPEIDQDLFADIIEFQRLKSFTGYASGPDLLARYNVAQVQVTLFRAVMMTIWVGEDFKTVLRYAKLAQLMHSIARSGDGYLIRFDGPASVLRQTRRYGVAMARFLPALLACRSWRLHALVETRVSGRKLSLELSSADGLHSHLPSPDDFDSTVEQAFAEKWGDEPREGWTLIHEGEVLHAGQKTYVPDFVIEHEDGRRVLLEIVGFWTPEYLESKRRTPEAFPDDRILLAVQEKKAEQLKPWPNMITYKTVLLLKDVIESRNRPSPPTTGIETDLVRVAASARAAIVMPFANVTRVVTCGT